VSTAGPADLAQELRQLVLDLLARTGPAPARELDLDAELSSFGVDSLDHIQIAVRVHERYGVKLPAAAPGPIAPFRSLRTLLTVVQGEIDGRADKG
jgi:acyl carrier protein